MFLLYCKHMRTYNSERCGIVGCTNLYCITSIASGVSKTTLHSLEFSGCVVVLGVLQDLGQQDDYGSLCTPRSHTYSLQDLLTQHLRGWGWRGGHGVGVERWTWGGGGEVDMGWGGEADMGWGWRGRHGVGVERWTWGGGGEADMGWGWRGGHGAGDT